MSVKSIGQSTATVVVVPQYGNLLVAGTLTATSNFLSVSNLSQTYRHLRVILRDMKSANTTASYIQAFFNGSYSNFVMQSLTLDTNSYYPGYNSSNLYLGVGTSSLKNSTWVPSAHMELTILNYSSTTQHKHGHFIGGGQSSTDRIQSTTGSFHWSNNAAITSFGFYTAQQFSVGSTIEVYGEGPLS